MVCAILPKTPTPFAGPSPAAATQGKKRSFCSNNDENYAGTGLGRGILALPSAIGGVAVSI